MKILIIINSLGVGGAERLAIDEINEMRRRGLDVYLLTLKPEKPGRTLAGQLNLPPDRWIKLDFGSLLNLPSWLRIIRTIRLLKPEAIVTHLWYSNTIGRVAGRVCHVSRMIVFEHNVYDTLKTKKMFWVDRFLQHFCSRIVAVSAAVRESLIRNKIDPSRIETILNGIDTSPYESGPSSDLRGEIKAGSDFIYVFVGRLIRQKGVDILLRAFSKTTHAQLAIVGTGQEKESIAALAAELGLNSVVHFLGVRQDIPKILLGADCFVLPSRYEGLPMVLLEALAAHIPIITSDFPSSAEIIIQGKNGLIVPRENAEALFQAMETIRSNETTRKELTDGTRRMSSSISISRHVDLLLGLLPAFVK